jgi:hypothetical protein
VAAGDEGDQRLLNAVEIIFAMTSWPSAVG